MNNALIQFKVKERLNKIDSHDYTNIGCNVIVEAFNKYQLELCRTIIRSGEATKEALDDIQPIIKDIELNGINKDEFFESELLPTNYFAFLRVNIVGTKDVCTVSDFDVVLAEQGNATEYLNNWTTEPSFEWRETFCTLKENRIRVYTANNFQVNKCILTYYRYPQDISFNNCEDELGNITQDVPCEFKKDVVERIISGACQIIAGDIENPNQITINNNDTKQ